MYFIQKHNYVYFLIYFFDKSANCTDPDQTSFFKELPILEPCYEYLRFPFKSLYIMWVNTVKCFVFV